MLTQGRHAEIGRGLLLLFAIAFPLVTGTARTESTHTKYYGLILASALAGGVLVHQVWSRLIPGTQRWVRLGTTAWLILSSYVVLLLGASWDSAAFVVTGFLFSQLLARHVNLSPALPEKVTKFLLLLSGVVLICTFATTHQPTAIGGGLYRKTGFVSYCCCAILFIATAAWFRRADISRAISWILAGGVAASLIGLWQFFDFNRSAARTFLDLVSDPRSMGPSGHPNWFASYLLLLFPLAAHRFLTTGRWTSALTVALLYANVLTSETRGAWIGLAVFLTYLLVAQRELWRRILRLFALLVVVTATLAPMKDWQILRRALSLQREATLASGGATYAGTGRIGFWKYAFDRLPRHALLGSGLDTFAEIAPKGTQAPNTKAHSIYFEYMITLGIPGLVLYLAFLWKCFANRREDFLQWTLWAMLMTYLVQGIFIHDTLHSWPMLWMFAAFAIVVRRAGPDISRVPAH